MLLTLLPAGQLSRSAQPTARSGLSGKPCWLCRMGDSGHPSSFWEWLSVELPMRRAEEQVPSKFLSRITIAAQFVSILIYDLFLIPVAHLNDPE